MSFAICHLSIVPVRADHSDPSEIVTQLLFGEKLEIIEEYKQWRKIKIKHDTYEGWIDHKQVESITKEAYDDDSNQSIVSNSVLQIESNMGKQIILKGSYLYNVNKNTFALNANSYEFQEDLETGKNSSIEEHAKQYLNAPYLWGGRNPFGIDCSGFTQLVFRFKGIHLKRDASQQVHQGEVISFDRMVKDDVVFFENAKGNVTHVGIYLGDGKIIHAHGQVRIDTVTIDGIINSDTKELSHDFHGIRRYI